LSNLLGVPFELKLDAKHVDEFMVEMIWKKLRIWGMVHLLLAQRVVVANFTLTSSLLFFLSIWGGFEKVIRKCKGLNRNFLWA
jgi:hypothetical protein